MNVAIIPARGGSRRIPRKNAKLFHGKPIIAYSIEAAKESGLFDGIIVSTDDDEIIRFAMSCGAAPLLRSAAMSRDEIGTQEVMKFVLDGLAPGAYDYACCIYPCAPMMSAEDLKFGYQMLRQCAWPPYFGWHGIYYFGKTESFLNGVPLSPEDPDGNVGGGGFREIGTQPSERYIDINTPEDWTRAEVMYAKLQLDAMPEPYRSIMLGKKP